MLKEKKVRNLRFNLLFSMQTVHLAKAKKPYAQEFHETTVTDMRRYD